MILLRNGQRAERQTMSVSKYAYTPEFCDGIFCIGDCDLCGLRDAEIDEEDEDVEKD